MTDRTWTAALDGEALEPVQAADAGRALALAEDRIGYERLARPPAELAAGGTTHRRLRLECGEAWVEMRLDWRPGGGDDGGGRWVCDETWGLGGIDAEGRWAAGEYWGPDDDAPDADDAPDGPQPAALPVFGEAGAA